MVSEKKQGMADKEVTFPHENDESGLLLLSEEGVALSGHCRPHRLELSETGSKRTRVSGLCGCIPMVSRVGDHQHAVQLSLRVASL